jgi:hypothetical protein
VQDALLYAVLQLHHAPSSEQPLSGQAALAAIAAYMSQAGAYVDGQAPFIECCHGSGEIAQAAIRACCVHGGACALAMLPEALLVADGHVTGVQMPNGHVVRCSAVAITDSVCVETCAGAVNPEVDDSAAYQPESRVRRTARAVALLDQPILPESGNVQFVLPPGACGNDSTIFAWQQAPSSQVCWSSS